MAGIGALGFSVAWGVDYWTHGRFLEHTDNAYLSADSVTIAPKVAGYVTNVLVHDNQPVNAGTALLTIDRTSYQAAVDMAQAEVAQRKADLVRFRAEVAQQAAVRTETVARVGVANAAARFASRDALRFGRLAGDGADTAQRYDQASSLRDQTAGEATAARAAVDTASRQLDALRAQIGQGEAALQAAEARLRSAQSDLNGIAIAAPVAGVIGDRTVRPGQYVQAGTRLMTVVPVRSLYVLANFKETQIDKMRTGQPVHIEVDAHPDLKVTGVIDSLAPGTGSQFALLPPENATGNFTKIVQRVPVRIRLTSDASILSALRPGLSVEVSVDTKGTR